MSNIEAWSEALIESNRSGSGYQPPWSEPPTLSDAYAVQDAVLAGLAPERGAVGGYKVAVTAAPMQEMMGLTEPLGGLVHERQIWDSPRSLSCSDYLTPAIEFEVSVRIGRDVPASDVPYTRATIEPFIGEVLTSFEIIDTRGAAIGSLGAAGLVADRCGCVGLVLGAGVTEWSNLDLASAAVEVEWNGAVVETGVTGAAMGHPFEGLAWVANHLAARGRSLDAGQVVLTGSAFAPKPFAEGDTITYRIAGIGEATVTITP